MTKVVKKNIRFIRQILTAKSPAIAYVAGWHGHQNLGDEAVYNALKQLFYPAGFIDYVPGLISKFLMTKLHSPKFALLAGGTRIGIKTAAMLTTRQCFELCPHSIVFGAGVEDLCLNDDKFAPAQQQQRKEMLMRWKAVLEKCDYIGVRGPMSVQSLVDIGMTPPEIIGDPALFFAEDRISPYSSSRPDTLGLNIGMDMWNDQNSTADQYIQLAQTAKKSGWHVKWFVVWPKDLTLTKKLAAQSDTADDINEIYEDCHLYLDTVRSVTVFVGMKLHSVILATCAYVPSIILEYQPKCRDYMQSIGQENSVIKISSFQAEKIWEIARGWSSDRQKISESLFQAIRPLRERQLFRAAEVIKGWKELE